MCSLSVLSDSADQKLLSKAELGNAPTFPLDTVDYGAAIHFKMPLLQRAATTFLAEASAEDRRAFEEFCQANASWLDDFALFMAVKQAHSLVAWTQWSSSIAARQPEALKRWSEKLAPSIAEQKFFQYEFFRQWQELRAYGRERNIRIIGDIPIYVAHDSADVWANRQYFLLDELGHPLQVVRRSARLLQRHRTTLGKSHLQLASPQADWIQMVDRALRAPLCGFTTSSALTTSAASKPTGRSPAAKPPR